MLFLRCFLHLFTITGHSHLGLCMEESNINWALYFITLLLCHVGQFAGLSDTAHFRLKVCKTLQEVQRGSTTFWGKWRNRPGGCLVLSNVLQQFEDIHLLGKHVAIFVTVFGRNDYRRCLLLCELKLQGMITASRFAFHLFANLA